MLGGLFNLIGTSMTNRAARREAQRARQENRDILQNQIQWRVKDSEAAGLHPLAALGVTPAGSPAAAQVGDYGAGMGQMGQDISRAVEAIATPKDKAAAQLVRLQVERGSLENDLLRTQIASSRMRMMQDAVPGISGSDTKSFLVDPIDRKADRVFLPGASQDVADHYGDIMGEIYGLGYFAHDLYKHRIGPQMNELFEWGKKHYRTRAPSRGGGGAW